MRSLRAFIKALLLSGGAVAAAACGNIDNAIDCDSVCDRYRSCFDSSYDTGACYDRCRSNSSSDSDWQHKVDRCDACISGRDCTAAAFNCAGECAGVVP